MLLTITELLILINAKKTSMVEKFSGKFNSQDRKKKFFCCFKTAKPLPTEAKETIKSQMHQKIISKGVSLRIRNL